MKQRPADGWFVYILRCSDGSLYTGISKDVGRRCRQHNEGTASRYTRSRRPVRLAYQERQPDQSAALRREAAIKALSHREKEALVRSVDCRSSQDHSGRIGLSGRTHLEGAAARP